MIKTASTALFSGWLARLRAPWLLALTLGLFVLDLLIPDVLPFVDEALLGLAALLLSCWRRPAAAADPD